MALVASAAACQPDDATSKKPLTWHIQLSGAIDTNLPAQIFDLDGFNTPASTVKALNAKGKITICYVDLGSIENYRADYGDFAPEALSKQNPEWPDEQWLNILRLDVPGPTGKTARQLLQARLDMCKDKGFHGVDPDMIEVYAASGVTFAPASRKITYADQITFNRWIADEAHARGMLVGLKGDIEQARDLAPYFDFSVNEECHYYDECHLLDGFTKADKPVLNIEYAGSDASFVSGVCPKADRAGFFTVKKKMSLNAWTLHCPS
ncbi:MAG TPA: endo alpha-1,4 polygalactosaminidase [Acidimicrobiales bacterium]|nr:endo alpha-1,4 polygalactosaminidase [Acidimicrobiales bacterium]